MGVRTFARIKNLIWDQLLATKAEIFVLRTKPEDFVIWNVCFCSLSKGIFNALKKGIPSPCNALTAVNNIVFTAPEAMVEFSGENSQNPFTFVNLYSF